MNGNNTVIISESFTTQLITGILSAPIVYIPHYHYNYVDVALSELLPIRKDKTDLEKNNILGLYRDSIYEYDLARGRVDFESKRPMTTETSIQINSVLKNLLVRNDEDSECPIVLNGCKILLLKNVGKPLFEDPNFQILLQTFAEKYEKGQFDELTTIIIVSPFPVFELPSSIKDILTIIEIPTPSGVELNRFVSQFVPNTDDSRQIRAKDNMVRTLQGLQMYDVIQTLRTALKLRNGRMSDAAVRLALAEKKRIVKKSGIIEVVDTNISFEDIGGLGRLVNDLKTKSKIYSHLGDAEKYQVPIPKGILIVGMPGCGKSMIAQATANEFGVSLLRLDVSRLMGKYVGESESNLRKALATAEAAHPCVLWIDEIEKAFAGTNNSGGDNDMLVMRMMGHFLTWMQERTSPVYIVATANDVMRPEFMRKGRFDEVYFVDFPDKEERAQILRAKIAKRYPANRTDCLFDFTDIGDCKKVVESMEGKYGGFSGSEIESVLNMVVEEKFMQYLNERERSTITNYLPDKIKILKTDFNSAIEKIRDSVMANQQSQRNSRDEMFRNKTAIERIRDMQGTYKFVNAKG